MSYSRILFLDFDGVMTSVEDGSSHLCKDPDNYRMSSACQKWLSKLFKEFSDIKVVLSTSWLKYPDLQTAIWIGRSGHQYKCHVVELMQWLSEIGVYLDKVDYSSDSSKFGRIMTWVNRNYALVDNSTKFLVLDDDSSRWNLLTMFNVEDAFLYGKYKFINVDPTTGFNRETLRKSIEFFKGED